MLEQQPNSSNRSRRRVRVRSRRSGGRAEQGAKNAAIKSLLECALRLLGQTERDDRGRWVGCMWAYTKRTHARTHGRNEPDETKRTTF